MNLRCRFHGAAVLFFIAAGLVVLSTGASAPAPQANSLRLLQPEYISALEATPLAVEVNSNTAWSAPYRLTISSEDEMVEQTVTGTLDLPAGRGTAVIALAPRALAPFGLGETLALSLQAGGETATTEATLVAEPASLATSTWSISLANKPAMLYTTKDATMIYSVVNPKTSTKNATIKVKFLYQKPNGKWKKYTLLQTVASLSPGDNTISISIPSSLTQQMKTLGVSQEKAVLIVGGIVRRTEQAAVDYDLSATASATPTSGVEPLDVSFTADATGGKSPYSFNWDFGDGNTSPDQNPLHTYTTIGSFTANVQVVDSLGGVIHKTLTITVQPVSGATCSSSKESGTVPLTVDFSCTPNGGVSPYTYDWNYGDSTTHGTTKNPSHTYTTAGAYTYTVTVTDAINQTANCGGTINVYPVLTVTATATPPSGTVPLSVAFTSTPLGGKPSYTYDWDYGDGTTHGTVQNPSHQYTAVGTFTYKVVVTDSLSNTANATGTITVSNVPTYTLTVSLGTGTTGTPATTANYSQGTVVPYSYSAQSCYGSLQVLLDGSPVSASGSVTMNGNHSLNVTSTILTYTVTFVHGTGGTITGTTSQVVNCGGSTSAVTAVPNGGYNFVNWTGAGFTTTTSNPLTVTNVTQNLTITANFSAVPTYTLTVSIGTGATGTPATTASYAQGTVVNYSYSAISCYGSLSVLLDGSPVSASGSVTMNGPHTLTVSATLNTYTIVASVTGGNGTINPSGTVVVNCGGSQNFTFSPSGSYIVSNVLVDGSSVGHPSSYNFATVTSNHTISVSFVAVLSVSCTATPTSGMAPLNVSFTSTPSGGNPASYTYDWNYGDGTAHGTTQNPSHQYTVANPSYTATVTVNDGLQSAQCSKSIQVSTPITILSFTANPTSISSGSTSNLTATLSSTSNWTLTIEPSSTGTGTLSHSSGNGNTVSEVFTGVGTGNVRIWLTAGTATAYVDITVTP